MLGYASLTQPTRLANDLTRLSIFLFFRYFSKLLKTKISTQSNTFICIISQYIFQSFYRLLVFNTSQITCYLGSDLWIRMISKIQDFFISLLTSGNLQFKNR